MKIVAEVLKRARGLIEKGWTRGVHASINDERRFQFSITGNREDSLAVIELNHSSRIGSRVNHEQHEDVLNKSCFCAEGALIVACGKMREEGKFDFFTALQVFNRAADSLVRTARNGKAHLVYVNDDIDMTQEKMLRIFDETIANEERSA